jgi:hypothetical protein
LQYIPNKQKRKIMENTMETEVNEMSVAQEAGNLTEETSQTATATFEVEASDDDVIGDDVTEEEVADEEIATEEEESFDGEDLEEMEEGAEEPEENEEVVMEEETDVVDETSDYE